MRDRTLPFVGVSVVALLAIGSFATSATARGTDAQITHQGAVGAHAVQSGASTNTHPAKRGNCYSNQMNDTGVGILSQTFGDQPGYDSYSATNFSVKKTCKVTGVYAFGVYFNGAGPATSETVTFYSDAGGVPGDVENTQTVVGTDVNGAFTLALDTVALTPGQHWVSVSANMDLSVGGEWGWELSSTVKQGVEGQFENTGGAFGVCPTWGDVTDCVGYSGDFMVTLTKG